MRKIIYLVCALFVLTTGCKKNNMSLKSTAAELRIFNATSWAFYDCTVKAENGEVYNFGRVNVSAKSSYHTFIKLYRYSFISLTRNNKTYFLQPTDYVSEIPLESGRYTYKITYASANDTISLELIKG